MQLSGMNTALALSLGLVCGCWYFKCVFALQSPRQPPPDYVLPTPPLHSPQLAGMVLWARGLGRFSVVLSQSLNLARNWGPVCSPPPIPVIVAFWTAWDLGSCDIVTFVFGFCPQLLCYPSSPSPCYFKWLEYISGYFRPQKQSNLPDLHLPSFFLLLPSNRLVTSLSSRQAIKTKNISSFSLTFLFWSWP